MSSRWFNLMIRNKFLQKLFAIVSVFAITSVPVEARVPARKSHPAKTNVIKKHAKVKEKKARVVKAKKARVVKAKKARVVKTKSVKKAQPTKTPAPKKAAIAARPAPPAAARQAAAVRQRQAAARQAAEAARQAQQQAVARQAAEAARQAEQLRQQQEAARQAEQQAAAHQAQQQEAARQAEQLRQQQEAAWRQEIENNDGVARAQLRALLATDFDENTNMTLDAEHITTAIDPALRGHPLEVVPYNFVDLGYPNRALARTAQYGLMLPAAPVFHPYHPVNEDIEAGFQSPVVMLNVKLPSYMLNFAPEALERNLAGVRLENIDTFFIVQDMPWVERYRADGPLGDNGQPIYRAGDEAPLLLRPQYWLNPNAPFNNPTAVNEEYPVYAGVFTKGPGPGPRIAGQPEGGLLTEPSISIRNTLSVDPATGRFAVDVRGHLIGTQLISSGATLPIPIYDPNNPNSLDRTQSHVLYSLTKYLDPVRGMRAAVVKHILLNQDHAERFAMLMDDPDIHNIQEIHPHMGGFRLADEFDFLHRH